MCIAELERLKIKRRALGNVSFIGELYKLNMLTSKIIWACVLKSVTDVDNPDEEEVEALCRLLTTVGKALDIPNSSSQTKDKSGVQMMDFLFDQTLHSLESNKDLPSRVRFMVKDVQDLRKDKWKPRREKAGPKTIEDIHDDVNSTLNQYVLFI